MKRILYFQCVNKKHTNFNRGLFINRAITIIILFLFNSFYAQQQNPSSDAQSTTITLSNGVEIHSLDKEFNNQISTKKITLKYADVSFVAHKNRKILIASTSRTSKIRNLAKQAKDFEEIKKKKILQDLQVKIDNYKTKSERFKHDDFNHLPSPSEFFSSHSSTKNYITPTDSRNSFSKINVNTKDYSVKSILNYLHAQKITYYNNKSLDYCFYIVFSVRPPPVLA